MDVKTREKKENNNAPGFFDYDNAWYVKRFEIPESDRGRRMREGRISVAVKLGTNPDGMKLYAKSENLTSAVTNVKML